MTGSLFGQLITHWCLKLNDDPDVSENTAALILLTYLVGANPAGIVGATLGYFLSRQFLWCMTNEVCRAKSNGTLPIPSLYKLTPLRQVDIVISAARSIFDIGRAV